jgi:NADH:ubiquinone oxidoreductase subunit 2 (subunit N)
MGHMTNKKLASIMVGLLVLEFGLGVLASLYSTVPKVRPYDVFGQFGYIAFHALNGVILLVLSIMFLIRSMRDKTFTNEARGGLGSLVGAFIFGELFVFTQNDIFSFLMAMAFIGAFINYAKVAFRSGS